MQNLLQESLVRIKELENQLRQSSTSSSTPAELRRATPLVDITTPLKVGLAEAKKTTKYLGSLYIYIHIRINMGWFDITISTCFGTLYVYDFWWHRFSIFIYTLQQYIYIYICVCVSILYIYGQIYMCPSVF